MIAMLALLLLLSSAATWIQTTKDDLTYGRPRTFHIDVVVGHNDSPANPSHFIAAFRKKFGVTPKKYLMNHTDLPRR